MKIMRIALALAAVVLSGCATLSRTDQFQLQDHQVPAPLYTMMLHGAPISLGGIIELSQRKLSPGFIIRYLQRSEAVYRLSATDVKRLKAGSVAPEVIDYLKRTPMMFGAYWAADYGPSYGPYYYDAVAYGYPEPYYYSPSYYYGGPYFGVEGYWGSRYRGWGPGREYRGPGFHEGRPGPMRGGSPGRSQSGERDHGGAQAGPQGSHAPQGGRDHGAPQGSGSRGGERDNGGR